MATINDSQRDYLPIFRINNMAHFTRDLMLALALLNSNENFPLFETEEPTKEELN
jgi:hypothetical protein